jgi:basic amino acid/polyamine antiporter, APA family
VTVPEGSSELVRGLDFVSATSLNVVDMVGVGPFITLPLIVAALHGPQAIYGWIAGAIVAVADGLIWAELGAAMPRAGGSYAFLQDLYGKRSLGRLLSFLFVFQLIFSAPASIATGCIGLASYATFLVPFLGRVLYQHSYAVNILGRAQLSIQISGTTAVAMATAAFATFCVSRGIAGVARISRWLWAGVLAALLFVIVASWTHWNAGLAFPSGWASPRADFWTGFSSALLIALYDYWGYYNICFLGEEVRNPARTIPFAILTSIGLVALLYVAMNIGALGVLPAGEIAGMAKSNSHTFVAARIAQSAYGGWAGRVVSVLVIWTAFASVFSLLAGYSRIPFAAARDGNFHRAFAVMDARGHFPARSVLLLGGLACVLCLVDLKDLISALVVIRVLLLFVLQAIGVVLWRVREPEAERPFRMWLYPLPVIIAMAGFLLVLYDKRTLTMRAGLFTCVGGLVYLWRARQRQEWPFRRGTG